MTLSFRLPSSVALPSSKGFSLDFFKIMTECERPHSKWSSNKVGGMRVPAPQQPASEVTGAALRPALTMKRGQVSRDHSV